jgi:hypothetical protein
MFEKMIKTFGVSLSCLMVFTATFVTPALIYKAYLFLAS